jgi:hypothetical protein
MTSRFCLNIFRQTSFYACKKNLLHTIWVFRRLSIPFKYSQQLSKQQLREWRLDTLDILVDAPTHLAQTRSAEAAWQGSQAEEEDSYLLLGMA